MLLNNDCLCPSPLRVACGVNGLRPAERVGCYLATLTSTGRTAIIPTITTTIMDIRTRTIIITTITTTIIPRKITGTATIWRGSSRA